MTAPAETGSILLYQTADGQSKIEVRLCNDTVWLTAGQMAELFQRNKSTISRHIKNVFDSGELQASSTVAFFATVQNEGNRKVERNIAFYNLDMIISVGYRVNSYRGVQFRLWATQVLREYLVKGFAMNVAKEKFPIGGGVIIDNSNRYSYENILKLVKQFGSRSMQTHGVILPYWENAARWHVDDKKIIILGFSAGGHLAASYGTFWRREEIAREVEYPGEKLTPNGLVLCYPVIISKE